MGRDKNIERLNVDSRLTGETLMVAKAVGTCLQGCLAFFSSCRAPIGTPECMGRHETNKKGIVLNNICVTGFTDS